MARITVEDCIDKFPSRFELVLIASQRARKLYSGEKPTIARDNDKNSVIALREIAESKIPIEDMKESLIEEYQTITINDEENENLINQSADDSHEDEAKENVDQLQISEDSASKQIEEEIKNLTSAEDSELDENFEINEDLQSSENTESSENNEEENTS